MNAQFAIRGEEIFILEVNPRASRTVPFVSKATGLPLAKIAARAMTGKTLAEQGITGRRIPRYYAVKESVFPFVKFRGVDPLLGPEMKSTGEVMGVGRSFGEAYAKAQLAAGVILPRGGRALLSVRDPDKAATVDLARVLVERGFEIVATHGTAAYLAEHGVPCQGINKVREGRPHVVDLIKNDELSLIVNTTEGKQAVEESRSIRREAVQHKVTYYTTIAGAKATLLALDYIDAGEVNKLQDLHEEMAGA
jgi:carbamoyl-phosphate synthase large subunit